MIKEHSDKKATGSERRKYVRVPLDAPYFATLVIEEVKELTVMLIDLGCGGIQLAIPPQQGDALKLLGSKVKVFDLPHLLDPGKEGCSGQIVWVSPQRCGVRFDKLFPLTDWQIQAIAHEL